MTDQIDRTIVQPAAAHARDRKMHRLLWLAAGLLLAGVVALFVLSMSQRGRINDLADLANRNASVSQQLADQVRQLGATPVVTPAAGPAGTPGVQGATGAPGSAGAQGPKGDKGDTGATGPSGPPGPSGAQGAPGTDGQDGVDGTDGKDGATGPAGPAGQQGESGPPGPQGEQGPPGPTCPEGYTPQSRKQGTETWWVCVADDTPAPTTTP